MLFVSVVIRQHHSVRPFLDTNIGIYLNLYLYYSLTVGWELRHLLYFSFEIVISTEGEELLKAMIIPCSVILFNLDKNVFA